MSSLYFFALSILVWLCSTSRKASSLPTDLNIDKTNVLIAGRGNSADFAHQFHVSFSSMVSGSCIFSGQPFHCAVSKFAEDSLVAQSDNSRVPHCDGCPPLTTLPFNHCKVTPNVVDVGSLVDYPRRHCGQNPISIHHCIDDVYYLQHSKVFISRHSDDIEGAVENTVGLMAQMMADPQRDLKYMNISDDMNMDETAEIGHCLQHIYDAAPWMKPGHEVPSNWYTFDQTPFFKGQQIGFQDEGSIYIPERCRKESGDQVCKLIIRPDTCTASSVDVNIFAAYAEVNGMVVLQPCMGGGVVNTTQYPNSKDIQKGEWDVYGQLSADYVQQSAPHMAVLGNMVRTLLGMDPIEPVIDREHIQSIDDSVTVMDTEYNDDQKFKLSPLPTLNIDTDYIATAGCSNTADFSHQFHVAFSSIVTGSCIFSGMPFHCAVTRFDSDYMVPKAPSTAAGIHCVDCDANGTLIYDHCKNHPHWVNVDVLAHYAETAVGVDDPKEHLKNARVFAFGPTHDRCYQPPSMENVANFHLKYAVNASQIKLVDDQPFPHTLPTNSTPYFNDNGNTTGAGYDGPGECVKHVFGDGQRLYAAKSVENSWWKRINVSPFVPDKGVGMRLSAWLFVPPQCDVSANDMDDMNGNVKCKLLILPGGCDAAMDPVPPSGGSDRDFAKYGAANDIVILKPCQGGPISKERFPENHENLRGMVDVYGQLSADYATQNGDQMKPIGNMMKKLIGYKRME